MSDYIDEILSRADLQIIRAFLINGIGDENDVDPRPYRQRIDEDSASMRRWLEREYPDGARRDAVFADISCAQSAHQDVFFELGMRCGARIMRELLV